MRAIVGPGPFIYYGICGNKSHKGINFRVSVSSLSSSSRSLSSAFSSPFSPSNKNGTLIILSSFFFLYMFLFNQLPLSFILHHFFENFIWVSSILLTFLHFRTRGCICVPQNFLQYMFDYLFSFVWG